MFPMTVMHTPTTRAEFEQRINMLREQIIEGRLRLPADPDLIESFLQLRTLPNGRIDLLSVNETVRLQANMTHRLLSGAFSQILEQKTDEE